MTTPFRQWVPEEAMAACSDRAPAWISGSEETKMDSANVANHVISGTTPLPPKGGSGSLNSSTGSTLAGNFQSFLTLLTTQLKNQNPLDPLDTNQFTQQLVQFAGVEQQLKSNDQLKDRKSTRLNSSHRCISYAVFCLKKKKKKKKIKKTKNKKKKKKKKKKNNKKQK